MGGRAKKEELNTKDVSQDKSQEPFDYKLIEELRKKILNDPETRIKQKEIEKKLKGLS